MPTPGQALSVDRVIVAHLRMNIPAALALKAAIEGALLWRLLLPGLLVKHPSRTKLVH